MFLTFFFANYKRVPPNIGLPLFSWQCPHHSFYSYSLPKKALCNCNPHIRKISVVTCINVYPCILHKDEKVEKVCQDERVSILNAEPHRLNITISGMPSCFPLFFFCYIFFFFFLVFFFFFFLWEGHACGPLAVKGSFFLPLILILRCVSFSLLVYHYTCCLCSNQIFPESPKSDQKFSMLHHITTASQAP